jgi:type I restriction enzyme R subunit
LEYEEFLKKIEELARELKPENRQDQYPSKINTPARQALYDILEDKDLALVMDEDIAYNAEENWIGNILKERKVRNAIKKHLDDDKKVETIFEVVKNQKEYRS